MNEILKIIIIIVLIVLLIAFVFWLFKSKSLNGGKFEIHYINFDEYPDFTPYEIILYLIHDTPDHLLYYDDTFIKYEKSFIKILASKKLKHMVYIGFETGRKNIYLYSNKKDFLTKLENINIGTFDNNVMLNILKYMNTPKDYINIAKTSTVNKNLIEMFKFNPLPIKKNIKNIFVNASTCHIYEPHVTNKNYDEIVDTINKFKAETKATHIIIWSCDYSVVDKFIHEYGEDNIEFKSIAYDKDTFNNYLIENNIHTLIEFTVPDNVQALSDDCFDNCFKLTKINIPSSVRTFGKFCFACCHCLSEINIPSSVSSLGDFCFECCEYMSYVNIPTSVSNLSPYCFYSCENLSEINIPTSVTSIGDDCFHYCSSLSQINIPTSVTSIGDWCFSKCSSLSQINIPSSVSSISDWCFANCEDLSQINIPSSVSSIGESCFYNCNKLTNIIIDVNNPIFRTDGKKIFKKDTGEEVKIN